MIEPDFHEKYSHLIDGLKLKKISELSLSDELVLILAESFKALGDPTRLKIVLVLRSSELCVHEIASSVQMSVSAVSHQLRLLRALKIVKLRKQGKMSYYSLDDEHIIQLLDVGIMHIQEENIG